MQDDRLKEALLEFDQGADLLYGVPFAFGRQDELVIVIVQAVDDGDAATGEDLQRFEDSQHVGVQVFAVWGGYSSDISVVDGIDEPIRRFLAETYDIAPIFDSGGQIYGWNLQYRKGGRPLCEMYPERGSFTALVMLGKAELEQALERLETFGSTVQRALVETPRYHDGCWMYIRVADPLTCQKDVQDIEQLILIKRKPPKKKAVS